MMYRRDFRAVGDPRVVQVWYQSMQAQLSHQCVEQTDRQL